MLELVKFVVETFAENKDVIVYDVVEDGRNVNITVTLDPSDMGKVIGRQGKIAKAIRTLVKAASFKENKRYSISIQEKA